MTGLKLSAFEQTYVMLHSRLREGYYAPGSRIQANDIVRLLGISATPVREALSRLAGQGLLIDRRSIGYFVPAVDPVDLRNLLALASMLALSAMRSLDVVAIDISSLPKPSASGRMSSGELLVALAGLTLNTALHQIAGHIDDRLARLATVERDLLASEDQAQGQLSTWLATKSQKHCLINISRFYQRRIRLVLEIATAAGSFSTSHKNIFGK